MVSQRSSASKTLKKLQKKLKKLRPYKKSIILISLGLVLLAFGGINYYRVRILSFKKIPEAAQIKVTEIDPPVEIIIPSVEIGLPVAPGGITNGVWEISEKDATFLVTSSPPGTGGNTVIYGHNKKAIFGNLPYLSIGQKISIKTQSGKIYVYEATQKYFVGADRVDLVSPTDHEELTIYTCWGLFDSQRAVIKAKPLF